MQGLQTYVRRDDSPLVGVEAIKALAGWFPPRTSQLQAEGESPPDDVSDLRVRSRAWQVIMPSLALRLISLTRF